MTPPRESGSGRWMDQELHRTLFLVEARTAGEFPRHIGNPTGKRSGFQPAMLPSLPIINVDYSGEMILRYKNSCKIVLIAIQVAN